MLCKPTYVCAPCECSHFEPFCIHQHSQMCTYTYIQLYTSYHGFICVWTDRVQTYICLWPCECSHLKPLCIHTYIHRYTYFILQKLLYMTPCCANSHMSSSLASAHTSKPCFHTYVQWQENTYHVIDTCVYEPMFCKLTYVCALASAHT